MKRTKVINGFIVCACLCALVGVSSCQENFRERLEKDTKNMTARECPKRLDSNTVLDSIVFHDDGADDYKLYYTMEVETTFSEEFRLKESEVYSIFLKEVRNDLSLKPIKEKGLNIVYLFRIKGEDEVFGELRFTPHDYN